MSFGQILRKPAVMENQRIDEGRALPLAGNLRSALFDNMRTRPAVIGNYRLDEARGVPSYRFPLERSLKPLPTLPPIVGNTQYNPRMFSSPFETPGTSYLRSVFSKKREVLGNFVKGDGEPSNINPTVL